MIANNNWKEHMPFFIIFLLIPFLEISAFIWVGDKIGILNTLLFALGTAVLGGTIIKYQGIFTIAEMQNNMRQGQLPLKSIFDGFCLVAAGALLITPGFVTDTIGFSLLIPPVRDFIREKLKDSKRFQFGMQTDRHHGHGGAGGDDPFIRDPFSGPRQSSNDPNIIEGDYERVEDEDGRNKG